MIALRELRVTSISYLEEVAKINEVKLVLLVKLELSSSPINIFKNLLDIVFEVTCLQILSLLQLHYHLLYKLKLLMSMFFWIVDFIFSWSYFFVWVAFILVNVYLIIDLWVKIKSYSSLSNRAPFIWDIFMSNGSKWSHVYF